jgi:hypothetical protein
MKSTAGFLLSVVLAGTPFLSQAQTGDRPPDEIGASYRSWIVHPEDVLEGARPWPDPDLPFDGPRVVEIATGMNFFGGQSYVPSEPRFDLVENGFLAERVQHPTFISANINQVGAVRMLVPNGAEHLELNSTPVGIGIFDAESGESVIIGTITDAQGLLVGDHAVVFQNAFNGVCADIIYDLLGLDILEADVITSLDGFTVHFLDIYLVYHTGVGGVHCGTNAKRTPSLPQRWWKQD